MDPVFPAPGSQSSSPLPSGQSPPPEASLETLDPAVVVSIFQLAEELLANVDLDRVLTNLAERLRGLIEYETFAVLLLDNLGGELTFRLAVGYPEDATENWRFGIGQGLVGQVARTGKDVLVPERSETMPAILPQTRSALVVPLRSSNRILGALELGSSHSDRFTDRDRRLLSHLAPYLANAFENERLQQNLRDQANTLSLLYEVGRELTSILDRNTLLRRVAELVKRLVDYQLFSIMMWNEEKKVLEHSFILRFDERFRQKGGFPLGHGITGSAAALRQTIRVPNVHLDPRYTDCGHGVEVRSELAVPLVFKDQLIGVLDLESIQYDAFTEQQEQMLSTLASFIAVGLENARLYERVVEKEQLLARDQETARDIQRGLLPDSPPHLEGLEVAFAYEPARTLGGDFYDFLPYGDGKLAIVVGDVAGKSTPAALMASLAIGTLREHVVSHPCPPREMLGELNRHLLESRVEGRFVALSFSVYDPEESMLTVGNAGFSRPHLIRAGQPREIQANGVPLGLLPGIDYDQLQIPLQGGDIIVYCSDGIEECTDSNREHFGVERLRELLGDLSARSAKEIADGILHATDVYADGNKEQADDRTVVVLKLAG